MPWEPAIASFGVAAAALLVGGGILLRYQRDRYHFILMKTALEKGITAFPGATPGWLLSLRVGVLTTALGIGLMIAGVLVQIHTSGPIATGGGPAAPAVHAAEPAAPDAVNPAPPPPPSPEAERQHRLENQDLAGLVALSAGGILTLLGIVRIVFARLERRYTGDMPASS